MVQVVALLTLALAADALKMEAKGPGAIESLYKDIHMKPVDPVEFETKSHAADLTKKEPTNPKKLTKKTKAGHSKPDKSDDPDGAPRTDDPAPKYSAPFNLTNGACKISKQDRYVMEITNVAHGSYYIGKMGFGTPAQELNMLLDTGSDEIVVKGKGCQGCEGRGYDHTTSKTYTINEPEGDPQKGKEQVSYGSGDVWGQHVFDTISMGPLLGPGMDLLEVTETTIQEFMETTDTALEVIAGMAPGLPEYVGQRMASHMEVMRFSQCLPQNADENGFFVVNDKNPKDADFHGPFMSMGNYYWALSIDSMRFDWTPSQKAAKVKGSENSTKLSNKRFSMLVDTGTTLLSLPQDVMDELDKALENIKSDCSKMDQLPSLAFEIDGVTHSLPPSTYIAEDSGENQFGMDEKTGAEKAKLKEIVREQDTELKEAGQESELGQEREAGKEGEKKVMTAREKAMQNLYFKNKRFVNSKTGAECHLLFTQPITMNSTLGEIGILGMPLFRNYIVSFDFCQRQIWTKPHDGDCASVVGRHPSNMDACKDNDWLFCLFQSLGKWFVDVLSGFGSIFSQESTTRQGPRLKYQPGTERISVAARSLIHSSKAHGGGIIEL